MNAVELAYLALLISCGARDDEVDGMMAAVHGHMLPSYPQLAVRHARDTITAYRMVKRP